MTAQRAALLGGVVLVLTGCGTLTGGGVTQARPPVVTQPTAAARSLKQADVLVRDGWPGAAQALYLNIPTEFPLDPSAPQALYRLGILQADPMNPSKDYRAARATFTRLLADYPRSSWDTEARAWQATLTELLLREDDSRRTALRLKKAEDDLLRMRTGLDRLKQTDLEAERKR